MKFSSPCVFFFFGVAGREGGGVAAAVAGEG